MDTTVSDLSTIVNANLPLSSKLKTPEYVWGQKKVTVGSRSDGAVYIYRNTDTIFVNVCLIAGGSNNYTLSNFIPTKYAPSYTVSAGLGCISANNVKAEGRISVNSTGTLIILTGTTSEIEIHVDISYPAKSLAFN